MELRPDLDQVEGLSAEREALWARLEKATFLTANEKRAAVGYGPVDAGGAGDVGVKFSPDQPRVPGRLERRWPMEERGRRRWERFELIGSRARGAGGRRIKLKRRSS